MNEVISCSKAEVLENLRSNLKSAIILPLVNFSVSDWKNNKNYIIEKIKKNITEPFIVRSSALSEDSSHSSLAGKFTSVANVSLNSLPSSVEKVINSFDDEEEKNQIFVQHMLSEVKISGVAFTKEPNNGSDYFVINYDDFSGKTDTVTSGNYNNLKVLYHFKHSKKIKIKKEFENLLLLLFELEKHFDIDSLDVEFAIDKNDNLHLLQVRPLVIKKLNQIETKKVDLNLDKIYEKICSFSKPHPYLHGSKAVFGVMPDWNPAEIIGIRPRQLSFSLYKELVTDGIWSYQRDNYGYRNLRSFPLMLDFGGMPFIDVRVSFNSFVPADVSEELAAKLVNFYTERLSKFPANHDKVEFEIIYSCYTLDLQERMQILKTNGFTQDECTLLMDSLRNLTNNIININAGLWKGDVKKIDELKIRQKTILESNLDSVSKIYWLTEDCKRYGTLPFAGLARAGFIAIQMLRSLVNLKILDESDYNLYLSSLNTISSSLQKDFYKLSKQDFLLKYGHLRPGTYDILSARYDECPDLYFDFKCSKKNNLQKEESFDSNFNFQLSLDKFDKIEKILKEHGLDLNVLKLFEFIKGAIEGREYAKFVFTKSLSEILSLIERTGTDLGFSKEDLSYCDFRVFTELYSSTASSYDLLFNSINYGKEKYKFLQNLVLPSVIVSPEEVFSFELTKNEPNYITLKSFVGEILCEDDFFKNDLANKVVMIVNADPGYDWIFSKNVSCFITMYGGANSHMAIRALELGIPAVIGVGEKLFNYWKNKRTLSVDCANKKVIVLS